MDNFLNRIPSWLALSRLGKSPLLHLTILAPFIGWLILFNQHFVDFLAVSKNLVFDTETSANYSISRLHHVYFGLVALGVASFLFTLFCPPTIKGAQSEEDYVSRKREILSYPTRATLITELSQKYIDTHPDNSAPSLLQRASFPSAVENHFHDTFEVIYRNSPMNEGGSVFISATDNLMFEKLAEMLANRRRLERSLWQLFHARSEGVQTDLLKLEFNLAEFSKPLWRLTIALLYAAGLILLAFPTIETTLRILKRMI